MPIGYPMNDLQGFITSGAPIDARSVVRKAGLRGWRFHHAPAEQRDLAPYHYRGTTVQAPVIDLSSGYQAYIGSRSKHLIKQVGKKRRALERQLGEVSFEWGCTRPAEYIRRLIDWKSSQYYGTHVLFSDPATFRIVSELTAAGRDDCRGIVHVLLAGEQLIAVRLGLMGPQSFSSWFASYDPGLSRFSPGMMMWFPLAAQAVSGGISRIDLGYGQHGYKFRLANDSYTVAGGAVWASRAEEAAREIYRRLWSGSTHLR